MKKLLEKWWWVISGLLVLGIYLYGYQEMFFHQDDLDWFILVNRPFWQVMLAPIGDHVNYLFRVLFKMEWDIFGLYFPGYLLISIFLHVCVTWVLYILAKLTSNRRDLSAIVALLFTINTNWTEVVLWISGQTISITALFVLLAIYAIWRKKNEVIMLFLASITSALALGMLGATVFVFKKLRWKTLGILFFIVFLYYFKAIDGTRVVISFKWLIQVFEVSTLMFVNTVLGRLIMPFEGFEMWRIALVCSGLIVGLYKFRDHILSIWNDNWSRFLLVQIGAYNLIVAVGRAQYGVGIMRAERYGYLGLALFLLLSVWILKNWKIGRWIWVVPVVLGVQTIGLYVRARSYVIRPQQLRLLFETIKKSQRSQIDLDAFLPNFVLNDERLKYSDLVKLLHARGEALF